MNTKISKNKKYVDTIENTLITCKYNKYLKQILKMTKNYDCYIIGGFVRDCIINEIHNTNYKIHDLDLIVDDSKKKIDLGKLFSKLKNTGHNRHKGIKWIPEKNLEIDINVTSRYEAGSDIKKFLKVCDMTTGAIAYNPKNKIILNYKTIDSIKNKEIDIIRGYDPEPLLFARVILHANKLGFSIGNQTRKRINQNYKKSYNKEIKKYFEYKNWLDKYPLVIKELNKIKTN